MSATRYEVVLRGAAGPAMRAALDDMNVEFCGSQTTVRADLDQAGLTGLLDRCQQLGAEILDVHRVASPLDHGPDHG